MSQSSSSQTRPLVSQTRTIIFLLHSCHFVYVSLDYGVHGHNLLTSALILHCFGFMEITHSETEISSRNRFKKSVKEGNRFKKSLKEGNRFNVRLPFSSSKKSIFRALAINKSRMTHEKSISRNRSTTSRTHQRTQTPPIQTTKAAAPPQTTKAASPSQTIEAAPSNFKQCTFVPTTGVTQHVLPGPALHHTTMVEEAGDQTVSDEEEEVEQAFFDRQREMIKIVDYGLLFGGSRVMTPK
ncbi:unnamed protein product [Lathyrus oleraceus]